MPPISPKFHLFQKPPRKVCKEVELKVKEEIEKLLKAKFIRSIRYVQWLANIVPMMKKTGKLLVCVDFRDLNVVTPKDMYVMCHTPDPGPTRLANPNRFRGVKPYTGTPFFFFFFFSKLNLYLWYTNNFCNNQQSFTFTKNTTTGVVSIKIYTHLLSPILKQIHIYIHI